MEIYLLRHGIAEDGGPGRPDPERALTPEGRERLAWVLQRARSAEARPTLILSSPYRRAIETAQIAAEVLGYNGAIERTDALTPDASPSDAWGDIRIHKSEDAVLLASHEPLTSYLTAFLLNCPTLDVDVKKGALIRMDCDRFGSQPKCVLKWMLTSATARA